MGSEICERAGLSADEAGAVHSLIARCHPVDLNIGMAATDGCQFVGYQAGMLVGILSLTQSGEACLCVAPDARRRGVGRDLIAAADQRLARDRVSEMLVECDASSAAGHAFLLAMGGVLRHAEFRLRLTSSTALPVPTGGIAVVTAGPLEIARLAQATAVSFGDPVAAKVAEFEGQLGSPRYRFYLAHAEGSDVGGVRVTFYDNATFLTEFHTRPEARGKGYGREFLCAVCRQLFREGKHEILIETRSDNEAALRLYRACGFDVVRRYDYYARRVTRQNTVE